MALQDAKVGDYVWCHDRNAKRWLAKITHRGPKGRLYICSENDTDLMKNWRYGFHPETGCAEEYRYSISAASPEDIQAEFVRLKTEEEKLRTEYAVRLRRLRIESHGEELLATLKDILTLAEAHLSNAPSHPDNAKLEKARAVIVKAEDDLWPTEKTAPHKAGMEQQ
jgi:hypothetical protein